MEARELRIGNLVTDEFYDSFKSIITVESIDIRGINLEIEDDGKYPECAQRWIEPYYRIDTLRGIPLTEEWLVRLGFNYGGIWIELMGLMSCGRILQHKGMGAKSTAFYINEQFIANIQYLHELQNLYFALTGTELKTK